MGGLRQAATKLGAILAIALLAIALVCQVAGRACARTTDARPR